MNKDTFTCSVIKYPNEKEEIIMSATIAYYQFVINMYYKSAKHK